MWRALRPNREDRIAKLEWSPNGGLGRVIMGKVYLLNSTDVSDQLTRVLECSPNG